MKNFLLLFFLSSLSLSAQDFSVSGRVVAAESGEPLPFATIAISNSTRGVISNSRGEFRLLLRGKDQIDSLKVSYVGFKTIYVPLSSQSIDKLTIRLNEQKEQLDEVVVTSLTAEAILRNAFDRIAENYYDLPYQSTGFYRLTSRKNGKYVHLSEAVFDLYRSKNPKSEDLLKLVKMRAIVDEREAHGVDIGINPKAIFGYDEVNNSGFIKMFGKRKFLREHTLVLEGEYDYEGAPAYLISFDQKEGIKDVGLKGQYYIRKDDFAFIDMQYGISPKSAQYYKFSLAYQALMELFGVDIKLLAQETRLRYHKIGDKYYLKDAGNNVDFSFKSTRAHYNFILNMRVDYLVSEVKLEDVLRFGKEETLAKGQLIEFQNMEYDSLFWEDYSIVLPDTDFGEISRTIAANNEANDTKKAVQRRLKKYPKETSARLDSILTYYHDRGLFHGNVLIAEKDETILKKSYPFQKDSLHSTDRFRIGSTSKTFTSMLTLMLAKEGKITLSDSIGTYIPLYRHGHVTIDQLLSHTSGIPNYLNTNQNMLSIFQSAYTIDDLITQFCSDSLNFVPGTSFKYSNSGYVLLAKIIEVVEKQPYGQVLSKEILKPLGMEDTFFGVPADSLAPVQGYYYGQPEATYPLQNVVGAGGITSTVEDLLKWSNALEKGSLIDPALYQEAITPRAAYKDWEADYGYGWMIDNYLFKTSKKHKIVYHPGTDMAFYSMFLKQPDEQITIILLSHTGDFPRFEISDLILKVLN